MKNNGFSIAELLIVMSITAFLSVILIYNFRSSATSTAARHQISSVLIADIRRAQSMTASGVRLNDAVVCGYGIHFVNSSQYIIYADVPKNGFCTNPNSHNFSNEDFIFETRNISNNNMKLGGPASGASFYDVMFMAPGPKTYINDKDDTTNPNDTADIYIYSGASCIDATNCTTISVTKSGAINLTN